jgi:hypothetical protein
MSGINVHSQIRYHVTIDTPKEGIEAWQKDFFDLQALEEYLRQLSSGEEVKIRDFIDRTRRIGEAHEAFESVTQEDFTAGGFSKLPPA